MNIYSTKILKSVKIHNLQKKRWRVYKEILELVYFGKI